MADDGIPEVGRAARLGQKMRGMGGIYQQVTPETKKRILDGLQARWESSLLALRPQEQARLMIFSVAFFRELDPAGGGAPLQSRAKPPRPPSKSSGPTPARNPSSCCRVRRTA